MRGRMFPGLEISRSFGDLIAHHIGVKSEPSVKIIDLKPFDKYIAIASGGIWKNLAHDDISKILQQKQLGSFSDTAFKKVKEFCSVDKSKVLLDTSMIVSQLSQ